MKDIVIYGAGGFGRETALLIEQINSHLPQWNVVGFCDDGKEVGEKIGLYQVLGGWNYINEVTHEMNVVIAIADPLAREKIRTNLANANLRFPSLVHPSVLINATCQIGEGSILCAGTRITVDVTIGSFVIVNLNCTLGHDCRLENFSSLMPAVNVSGNVKVEVGAYIGAGAILLQGITIGNYSLVGAGAVVNKSFDGNKKIMGVPARAI
jgi:sugar O-acyltransferase (sialic acid O-acetyltransferase NeuD family)